MSVTVYALDGVIPVVAASAFVHPSAVLIGDVVVGPECYIGPLASLRGDFGAIRIGVGANVQDGCVVHAFPRQNVTIEDHGHIGHGAILHGCTIGRNALVGMNAVVMDGVVVGESSIIAAQSFLKAGLVVPPRSLAAGTPAKVLRDLGDDEIAWKALGTAEYQRLARRCRASLTPCAPLPELDRDRPALAVSDLKPKYRSR